MHTSERQNMITTLKTLPDKYRERYISKVNRFLKSDYYNFLTTCTKNEIGVHRDPQPENGGLERFCQRAVDCDYKLGQKPFVVEGEKLAHPSTIKFGTLVIHLKDRKKSSWHPMRNIDDIEGFGISLNLLGWSRFTNIKVKELSDKILSGTGIGEIYNPPQSCRLLSVDGVKMSISAACLKCGVNRTAYQNRVRAIDDDEVRQSVFDEMRSESSDLQGDFKYIRKRHWIAVEENDFCDILAWSKKYNATIPFIVKRLVATKKEVMKGQK